MKWLREQTIWPSEGTVGQKSWDWRLSWYWNVSCIVQPVDLCWLLMMPEFNLIDRCSIGVRELEQWRIDQCQKTLRRAWEIVSTEVRSGEGAGCEDQSRVPLLQCPICSCHFGLAASACEDMPRDPRKMLMLWTAIWWATPLPSFQAQGLYLLAGAVTLWQVKLLLANGTTSDISQFLLCVSIQSNT